MDFCEKAMTLREEKERSLEKTNTAKQVKMCSKSTRMHRTGGKATLEKRFSSDPVLSGGGTEARYFRKLARTEIGHSSLHVQ